MSVVALSFVHSCKSDKNQQEDALQEVKEANAKPTDVVDITTETMEFQMPDTIPSGWVTWRYHNKSTQTHFILIDDYPEGKTLDTIRERILAPFSDWANLMNEGKTEEAFNQFNRIPQWFSEVKWPGGVGMISPGNTAETILKLEPGTYFIECYVKMNTGLPHTNMGMIKKLVVSEAQSNLEEPVADVSIDISGESGIVFDPPTKAGNYTFSVNFIDQKSYENWVGHDVNLVKLDKDTDINVLEAWMDWRDPKGLIEPAPNGLTFLGGVNEAPAGTKAYFKANIQPGKYALISEVPMAADKNLLKTFEITE
ncbi:hypothetical protein GCM10010465_22440 [Actinomadura fibrosa]